ncbi:MAG: FtsX-like permease family protein, partial [Pirellulaceae bacterium]
KRADLGWQLHPIRDQQCAAAKGTTPFDMLFLSLSLVVFLAALILVMLLFRLGIERRASQWGLLLSLGWPMARVRKLLSLEGWLLSVAGGGLGILLGIAYAYG